MWKSDAERVRFEARDGMELLATGSVRVFESQGKYQLYVTRLQPLGQGALELAFKQLHARLEREGLFAQERKKPLPTYPSRIALVTSRATAALADMLKVLRRLPWVKLCICNVPVQGDGSAERIADMLTRLSSTAHGAARST
jgi:exodeoxyribonuclease VII large subunit